VHMWLYRAARYLHRFHDPEQIYEILSAKSANCGRTVDPHEFSDAIRNSGGGKSWNPDPGKTASERRAEWNANPSSKRVPAFNPELAMQTALRVPPYVNEQWLKEHSKIPVGCSTDGYFRFIVYPGEQVLVFNQYKSQGAMLWREGVSIEPFLKTHWPVGAWFLCNPVDGKTHWNPRLSKNSRRSEESVTSFRYAVLECDQQPKEIWKPVWVKILVQIELPIVSIIDSGDKSVHALVRVSRESKEAWDTFKKTVLRPQLVPLGADDGALSAVRLTRLPGAYRGDQRQELLYLNPEADGTPIFSAHFQK
jgi:hypothetical protein